jgi:hypothetical protein
MPASSMSVRTATRKPSGAKRAGDSIWSTVFVGGRLHAHPHAGQAKNMGLFDTPVTKTAAPNPGHTGHSPAMKTCVLTVVPTWLTIPSFSGGRETERSDRRSRPLQRPVSRRARFEAFLSLQEPNLQQ